MLDRITPLLLTWNEAANIERTLQRLHWARRIVIIDSGSTDGTVEIARRVDTVVVYTRAFDSHTAQWNFGLNETSIDTEWVLALDADYVMTDAIIAEIAALNPADEVSAFIARFRYAVWGRVIASGIYPPVPVLFRRQAARYVQDGHTQRLMYDGQAVRLAEHIVHDDRKDLGRWLAAQDRYAMLECHALRARAWSALPWTQRIRRLLVIAPWLVPLYCLVWRRGVLDGRAGWYYALQRCIAESLLSLHLIESNLSGAPNAPNTVS